MGILSSGSEAVDAMARIRITGNITPPRWYKEITRENGKPYLLAVTLLSDIVYWYRPVEVRDEASGFVIGLRKKFKGDLLQKTYEQYADLYGESKRTVKAALDCLEKLGLIKKHFLTITVNNYNKVSNVMFIEIFPEKIEKISIEEVDHKASVTVSDNAENLSESQEKPIKNGNKSDSEGGPTKFCTTPYEIMYDPLQYNVTPPTENEIQVLQKNEGPLTENAGTYTKNRVETITDTTTENTTQTTTISSDINPSISLSDGQTDRSKDAWTDYDVVVSVIKENIEYTHIVDLNDLYDLRLEKKKIELWEYDEKYVEMEIADRMIRYMADSYCANKAIVVSGTPISSDMLRSRIMSIDRSQFIDAYRKLKEKYKEVSNKKAYTLSVLFNG